MQIPEGAQTVTAEGRDLMSALNAAAQQLGVDLSRVGHKLDLSHFRSLTGASVPRSTVRIIAWEAPEGSTPLTPVKRTEARPAREQEEEGGEATERARKERKSRKREREGEKPSELRAPEDTTTEASSWAEAWFAQLLKEMGVEGTVRGTGNTERVHLEVRAAVGLRHRRIEPAHLAQAASQLTADLILLERHVAGIGRVLDARWAVLFQPGAHFGAKCALLG